MTRAPSTARERHTTTVSAMHRALVCLISRCVTTRMGIKRHALVKTNEGLVGANGKQNKLDGVMFLDLTLGLRTHQVTCLFLFPETCKELRIHCSERPREATTCTAPAHPPRSTNDAPAPRTDLKDVPAPRGNYYSAPFFLLATSLATTRCPHLTCVTPVSLS